MTKSTAMINSDARMEAIQQAFAAATASILMFSLVALSFPVRALAEETTASTDTTVETQTEITETEPSTEEVDTAPEEQEPTDTTGTESEETPSLLQTTDIETDTFFPHPKQLTVIKELINDNGGKTAKQDFSFTVQKIGGDVTYYFDEDGSVTIPLPFGPYRVIEGDHEGYAVEYSDDCAAIVNAGFQNRTCTITNNDIPPKLTLVKEVVGGTATVADWTLSATGDQETPIVISGQSGVTTDDDFQAGSYTLTEAGSPVGYTAGNWDCDLTGTNGLTALNGNVLTLEAGDDITCSITNTFGEPQTGTATVHATKIVCENEADLPNWGADTEAEDAITITSTTASDFLLSHPTCHVQEGWQFEWGDYNAYYDLPDNTVGPSDSPTTGYSVFGPTDANGVATLVVDLSTVTQIRLREVMQNGYLHFTHENNNDNSDNVSPEFYCGSDVRNYDNIEYINNPEAGQTYYCVAWNVIDEDGEQPKSCTIVSDETTLEDGGPASVVSFIHEAWTTITGAKWIWGEDPVSNPEVDQTRVFTKTFSLVALPTDADIELAADNGFILKVNGTVVDDQIYNEANYGTTKNYDVTTLLHTGANTIEIEVKNFAQAGGTIESNPAGVIYKLVITGTDCGTGGGDGGENPGGPTVQTIVVRAADLETEVNRVIAALNNSGKWFFYNDETDEINNALGSFVTGPETAPEGSGSAQMTVTGTERRNLATYRFKDVELTDIKTLTFATYSQSAGNGSIGTERAPYLHFNVDFDNSDTWQRRLVYVPATNGVVVEDEWQNWDAINGGNALWVLSGGNWPATVVGPDAGVTEAGSVARTWNDILADYPNVQTRSTDSWFGFRVGEPYADGFTGNVDDFVIRIDNGSTDVTTTFDFEPTAIQTENESSSNGGNGGSNHRSSRRGSVAGNSTEGEVLGASCPLLEKYMRETFSTNDVDQVTKLKTFLNQELGLELDENGVFDHVTTLAVNVFQLKYSQDVLAPWVPFGLPNAQTPTGYVYKTTLHKINEIACPDLDAPFPQLP